MKKIVGIIAAAALATSAFAEISIGSWSRGAFVPFAYDGDTVRSVEGANWDGTNSTAYGVRTGLTFSGSTENAGFNFQVFGSASDEGAKISVGDNANLWVKPIDMFTVKIGKIDNNWGRQDVCFGMWDHTYRFGGALNVGEGVAAWRDHKSTGVELTLQPIEGLVIDYQAGFSDSYKGYSTDTEYEFAKFAIENSTTMSDDEKAEALEEAKKEYNASKGGNDHAYSVLWHNADFMIGYKGDFGFIRAIVAPQAPYTNKDGDSTEWATIGLAADLTVVENLWLSIGTTIPTAFCAQQLYNIPVGLGASYKLDPLTLHAVAKLSFIGKADGDNEKFEDVGFYAGVGADFAVNDMFDVIADFRFADKKYVGGVDGKDPAFGVYAGLAQKLTNATFDFGVELVKQGGASWDGDVDHMTFAVPLMITTSF